MTLGNRPDGSLGLPFARWQHVSTLPPAGRRGSRGGPCADGCGLQLVELIKLVKFGKRVGNGVSKRLGVGSGGAEHRLLHR